MDLNLAEPKTEYETADQHMEHAMYAEVVAQRPLFCEENT